LGGVGGGGGVTSVSLPPDPSLIPSNLGRLKVLTFPPPPRRGPRSTSLPFWDFFCSLSPEATQSCGCPFPPSEFSLNLNLPSPRFNPEGLRYPPPFQGPPPCYLALRVICFPSPLMTKKVHLVLISHYLLFSSSFGWKSRPLKSSFSPPFHPQFNPREWSFFRRARNFSFLFGVNRDDNLLCSVIKNHPPFGSLPLPPPPFHPRLAFILLPFYPQTPPCARR